MEQQQSMLETKQSKSPLLEMPFEIQKEISAALNDAKSFSEVLEKVNTLGEESKISGEIIKDEEFITDLAKKFITKRKNKFKSSSGLKIELIYFIQEIYKQNIPAIKALIRAGIDVNSYIGPEDTILLLAIKHRRNEALKVLIDYGANVDGKNGWNITPLIEATIQGNKEIVEMLLEARADVNAMSNHGTALMFAKRLKETEIAKILEEAGGVEKEITFVIKKVETLPVPKSSSLPQGRDYVKTNGRSNSYNIGKKLLIAGSAIVTSVLAYYLIKKYTDQNSLDTNSLNKSIG